MKTRLRSFAKQLRNNSTDAERVLWRHLRNSQLDGIKFRRQEPIAGYIIDFVSFETMMVIELDGSQHADNTHDNERDRCLRRNGFVILRFWDNEVMGNIEGVLEVIRRHFVASSPTP